MKTIYHPGYRRLMGKLRAARKDAGLRLVDLAPRVGRGRDWLHRVETSQIRLDVLQFVQLCRALNLSSPALLEELEESSDDDSFLAMNRPFSCRSEISGQYLTFSKVTMKTQRILGQLSEAGGHGLWPD